MSIGEKIAFFRSSNNMSAEDFAVRLGVSSQLIALWESGQVFPDENQINLLENIYGIFPDEYIARGNVPVEKISFTFLKEDADALRRDELFPRIVRAFIISSLLIAGAFSQVNVHNDPELGEALTVFTAVFFTGILLIYLVSRYISFSRIYRRWRKIREKYCGSVLDYTLFPSHIQLDVTRDGELLEAQQFSFYEIRKIIRTGKLIVMTFNGRSALFKENELSSVSPFLDFVKRSPLTRSVTKSRKYSVISAVLFVAAFLSLFAATFFVIFSSAPGGADVIEKMWMLYLFIPIPLASFIFGIYGRKKGYRTIKNIVIGIIMSLMLLLYGSFTFIFNSFNGDMSSGEEIIVAAEEITGIDFPAYKRMNVWSTSLSGFHGEQNSVITTVTIENYDSEVLRIALLKDGRWLDGLPSALSEISCPYEVALTDSYVLIYNIDTQQFNTLPEEDGTYHFLSVSFSATEDKIVFSEYEVNYAG